MIVPHLLLLLLLVLRVVLNHDLGEPRLVVFPAGPQQRASAGSVPRRTSNASLKVGKVQHTITRTQ